MGDRLAELERRVEELEKFRAALTTRLPSASPAFRARYSSECPRCGKTIIKGAAAVMLAGSGAVHEACVPRSGQTSGSDAGESGEGTPA